jgi:hypothetical protein
MSRRAEEIVQQQQAAAAAVNAGQIQPTMSAQDPQSGVAPNAIEQDVPGQ